VLPVDLAANAASLGARVINAASVAELRDALKQASESDTTTVIHIEADPDVSVPSYGSWWDVAVAEVSESDSVAQARAEYDKAKAKAKERMFL
jgi:3D-(3,5/4)-trihydroxycyclohexane-1,2-dione acylhydrolase (decyclizing)